jgi:hypothetical protein
MEETIQRICKQTLVEIYNSKFFLQDDRKLPERFNLYNRGYFVAEYIASKVPSLKVFKNEESRNGEGNSTLKNLCNAFLLLQRYEFKMNHEE